MCFYIRNNKKEATLYEALEDITCYKVLKKDLKSPYYNSKYILKELKTSPLRRPKIINGIYQFKLMNFLTKDSILETIDRGLHSFQNLNIAKMEFRKWSYEEMVIIECIIPKRALFYRNDGDKEYVSNKLIPIKKIKL